ncbi:MAG TPA: hypothetical protein VFX16_01760 [Pseudonocardiaceae bacterium]|nr:hypothetical protein [Pseudonocardiaceae bacterium]
MVEPILISIATALATKAAGGLYDLVRAAFRRRPDAAKELEAAVGAEPDSAPIHALATRLAQVEAEDPEFAGQLRATWAAVSQHAEGDGVTNQISGPVSGRVVQARDITGDINF